MRGYLRNFFVVSFLLGTAFAAEEDMRTRAFQLYQAGLKLGPQEDQRSSLEQSIILYQECLKAVQPNSEIYLDLARALDAYMQHITAPCLMRPVLFQTLRAYQGYVSRQKGADSKKLTLVKARVEELQKKLLHSKL